MECLNKIGLISYGDDDDEVFIGRDLAHTRSYSEEVSRSIDEEIHRIITECMIVRKRSLWNMRMCSTVVQSFFLRRKKYTEMNSKHFLQEKILWKKTQVYKITKKCAEFCEVCAHFSLAPWYYINRKNPPIHYIVFATPHKKKIPSPKKTALSRCLFRW